jgi:hypothetical protein
VRDFVAATTAGYQDALRDPARALNDLLDANPSLPRKLTAASLAVYLPLFSGRSTTSSSNLPFGTLQSQNVSAMSRWMLQSHLIDAPISPARYATNRFLRPAR